MAFSQGLTDVRVGQDGVELFIAWTSTAASRGPPSRSTPTDDSPGPGGRRSCPVPIPAGARGATSGSRSPPSSRAKRPPTSRRASIGPGGKGNRVRFSWLGGTYLDSPGHDDLQGFRIYRSAASGGAGRSVRAVGPSPRPIPAAGSATGSGSAGSGSAGSVAPRPVRLDGGPLAPGTGSSPSCPTTTRGTSRESPQVLTVDLLTPSPRPPSAPAADGRASLTSTRAPHPAGDVDWLARPPIKGDHSGNDLHDEARLQKPATTDRNWDVPVNANADLLDGMTAIGALDGHRDRDPSATLNVRSHQGNYSKGDGTDRDLRRGLTLATPAASAT